ncbi:MAG: soluble cytochrome b562 [Planctomycetota bacterium]|jgi:soluble cytochrome b562
MQRSSLLGSAALCAALIGWTQLSATPSDTSIASAPTSLVQEAAEEEEEVHEETVIESAMLELQSALKKLRRSVRKEDQQAASLEQIDIAQAAIVRAKKESPLRTTDEAEAARPEFLIAYRSAMIVMLRGLLELEEAILEGRIEDARALVSKIRDSEDPNHEKFMEEF